MASMVVKDRDGQARTIEAKSGLKLMEVLRDEDCGVAAICGGLCSCATCHVYVAADWARRVPPPEVDELIMLKGLVDYREGVSRLSCQIEMGDHLIDMEIEVAPES